ncbi:MAG: class I SAM-dependent methyltransferase [Candidatus Peregrinibacteria bacterium]|nr:class I SAM-dependent methyltransferase [Candidatus Peregrinibacteria bacterium]MDZ4245364.1 class I SAM-dependent methyltransferase [Candidatus Gracilibacteria bacterium]
MIIKLIVIIIYFIVILAVFVPLFVAGLSLAPWVPAPVDVPDRVNKLAKLKPGQVFYEIGCGDARVCHYIASKNPKAKVIGIEMARTMYLWSRFKCFLKPLKNLTIIHANALKVDLSDADIVYFYMVEPAINNKLKPKLLKDLKKGARIISYACRILEWKGKKMSEPGKSSKAVHVYTV